jgi:hypothetical protein
MFRRLRVLGNGRSLMRIDLSYGDTIGTNRIVLLHTPTYYVGVSKKLRNYWLDDARMAITRGSKAWMSWDFKLEGSEGIHVDYHAWWKNGNVYGAAGGSLFPMLQMGIDLGYDEFELLGCDGFGEWDEEIDTNHFDPGYWENVSSTPSPEKLNEIIAEGHRQAARRMKKYEVTFGTPSPFEQMWREEV